MPPDALSAGQKNTRTTGHTIVLLELRGTTPGTQHDKLTFTHAGVPQVTWGGTLVIELINSYAPSAGDTFDVFDFDAARGAGSFSSITLPTLTAGLAWGTHGVRALQRVKASCTMDFGGKSLGSMRH